MGRSPGLSLRTNGIRDSNTRFVADTDLITIMPRATTASYLEDRLVFLNFDHPQFHRPLGAIRRTRASANPIEGKFLSSLSR